MTESIKFGPEWLRNSVANVVVSPPSQQHQQQSPHNIHQQHPQSPSDIISRPVLSDHRYGREEMLSLCDKSARLPDALPRFRRLFVADWQMPLALQPITDDEQIGSRGGLGGNGAPAWGGTHIRPLMPAMGGRGSGIIRGGAIERGRGRGRGIYGSSYTRSTSLYDEEGRRWLDRNGTDASTAEWSAGSSVSPRKEGFSRNALESWRKGTREENEEGWRSNSNGTNSTGTPARDKWARSTSWRDGNLADNGLANEMDRSNGTIQTSQAISSSPTGNGGTTNPSSNAPNSIKMPIGYKKSWDEENSNLPEWATESFDYGGTFDASGAFHDSERGGGGANQAKQNDLKARKKEELPESHQHEVIVNENSSPSKFMNFLNDQAPQEKLKPEVSTNGPSQQHQQKSAPIAQMDKMVENFVAHLIMDDDASASKPSSGVAVKQPPASLIEWFYRDPQGDTQGAFSSTDMSEWYKAGYFQESLMVRRSIDSTFTPLGHLVKIFGASRPFITATLDGGPPIPQIPEVIDPYRMQRMMQTQQPPPPVPQSVVVPPPSQQQQQQQQQQTIQQPDNWSLMTAEQRMFFMQLAAHQQQQQRPVDPYVLKAPPPTGNSLDMRRMEYFQSSQQQPPSQQIQQQQPQLPSQQQQKAPEPDPIQQLIMQLQMQQKTGGIDAAQQWLKPPPPPIQQQQQQVQQVSAMMSGGGPIDSMQMIRQEPPPPQQQLQQQQQQSSSSAHWSGTPMTIWDLGKEQQQQQHHEVQIPQHHQQSRDEIHLNGIDDQHQQMHQMQKVESKKKKKEVKEQQLQQIVKEPPKVDKKPLQKEPLDKKKKDEKQKKEERTTQPAAPAPWVGHQNVNQGTSLTKIQKTEAQRRQVEMTAQKERDIHHQKQLEMLSRQENRDIKWNLQMANQVKTLDEIQAEEQTAAEREERASKKKEVVTIVGDIWNTGAHSMAWQQPKAWSGGAQSGQSNSGFWEDPIKSAPMVKQPPQMLSKSQTMATISTTKRQVQANQPPQQQQPKKSIERVENSNNIGKKRKEEKKKDDVNSEFTMWCNRTLHAMNGNVDIPTFVSFLQDLESPFEVKDYIKMYLGESKECTEFAKQFLEHRSKHRAQQRQMNAHIDDMCSPAPAINPQANSSGDFQEVKGKSKKVKVKKFMKAVDNRILGFTATSAEGRINVGDRDYGDS